MLNLNTKYMVVKFAVDTTCDIIISKNIKIMYENIDSIEDAELLAQYELSKSDHNHIRNDTLVGIFPNNIDLERFSDLYTHAENLAHKYTTQ